jgi:hypothetical protein
MLASRQLACGAPVLWFQALGSQLVVVVEEWLRAWKEFFSPRLVRPKIGGVRLDHGMEYVQHVLEKPVLDFGALRVE